MLVAEGYFLSVATSKLKTYAGDIIDHFDLRRYFAGRCTVPSSTGAIRPRATSCAHILATEPIEAARTVMIGDRSHDIVGASANGVAAIGVLWGYGDRHELKGAGAAGSQAGRKNYRISSGPARSL